MQSASRLEKTEKIPGGSAMSSKAMSLKGRINNYAKKYKITAQVVLQNYMFERFLLRLSNYEYQQKFVVKGGMLIAAIVGLDTFGSTAGDIMSKPSWLRKKKP